VKECISANGAKESALSACRQFCWGRNLSMVPAYFLEGKESEILWPIPSCLSGQTITPCPTLWLLPTFIIFTWIFHDSSFNLHPFHLDIQ
jgi:hypothetical protein